MTKKLISGSCIKIYTESWCDNVLCDLEVEWYQDKNRFYLDEQPEQENLRSDYFKKIKDKYFHSRFMECK